MIKLTRLADVLPDRVIADKAFFPSLGQEPRGGRGARTPEHPSNQNASTTSVETRVAKYATSPAVKTGNPASRLVALIAPSVAFRLELRILAAGPAPQSTVLLLRRFWAPIPKFLRQCHTAEEPIAGSVTASLSHASWVSPAAWASPRQTSAGNDRRSTSTAPRLATKNPSGPTDASEHPGRNPAATTFKQCPGGESGPGHRDRSLTRLSYAPTNTGVSMAFASANASWPRRSQPAAGPARGSLRKYCETIPRPAIASTGTTAREHLHARERRPTSRATAQEKTASGARPLTQPQREVHGADRPPGVARPR